MGIRPPVGRRAGDAPRARATHARRESTRQNTPCTGPIARAMASEAAPSASAPPATSFRVVARTRRTRWRRLGAAPTAPAPRSEPQRVLFEPEDAKEDVRDEKAIEKIEEHLLKMWRQESKMPVAQLQSAEPAPAPAQPGQQSGQQAQQAQQPRPIAFKIQLLPDYFCIDGLSLALPYSSDNQRFLQMIEQGRMPWDHLRSLPGLNDMCAGKYVNGGLTLEVEDKRVADHCFDAGLRHVQVLMDDDALLQDLQNAYTENALKCTMSVRLLFPAPLPPACPRRAPPRALALLAARRPVARRPVARRPVARRPVARD